MSLLEEIEKMESELATRKNNQQEAVNVEDSVDPINEEDEKEEKESEDNQPAQESQKDEESKPVEDLEKKVESEPPLDKTGAYRLRREKDAEKKRADELQRKLEELIAEKEKQQTFNQQEEQIDLPPEFQEIAQEHKYQRAVREFTILENQVRNSYPEYDKISAEYRQAMYHSIKIQNPRRSEVEISEMTSRAILNRAAEFARAGYANPVEELMHEAQSLGYDGSSFRRMQEQPKTQERLQPDLRKLAENRKRSAGLAASNGRQQGMMTRQAAAELTSEEWARLPNSEKARLLPGG